MIAMSVMPVVERYLQASLSSSVCAICTECQVFVPLCSQNVLLHMEALLVWLSDFWERLERTNSLESALPCLALPCLALPCLALPFACCLDLQKHIPLYHATWLTWLMAANKNLCAVCRRLSIVGTLTSLGLQEQTPGNTLAMLAFHLLKRAGFSSNWHLDEAKLCNTLAVIEAGYQSSNPYHNRYKPCTHCKHAKCTSLQLAA